MEERVAKQMWKEEKASRAAHAAENQRSAHNSAIVRKQDEKVLKERQERARCGMATEYAAHTIPPRPTLADYFTTSSVRG